MSSKYFSPPRSVWAGLALTPIIVVLAALLVGAAGGGASANAKPEVAAAKGKLVTSPVRQTPAQVQAYWTPQRMAAARPMPLGQMSSHGDAADSPSKPTGPPGSRPGRTPSGVASGPAGLSGDARSPEHQTYHVQPPFDRWQYFARYRSPVGANPPYISTVSKMFFTQYNVNYVCSATVIHVDGVLTAGHCVHAGNGDLVNGWSTNMLICPSWDNGAQHFYVGCWVGENAVVYTDWANTGDDPNYEIDFGSVATADTGTLRPNQIGVTTGWAGLAWNFPRDEHWMAFGYPAGAPFNGDKIITAASEYGYDDDSNTSAVAPYNQPDSVSMGNDMTGGSSGGVWFKDFGTGWYANGHNDWRHTAFPNEMNSPYYDDRVPPIAYYFQPPPPPPPPGACDPFGSGCALATTSSTNSGSTGETGEPNHAGVSLPLESNWYHYTPTVPGTVTVDTCTNPGYDTTLAAYTGASVGSLTEVASNDDLCGLQSSITFPVIAGTAYHVAVDGFSGSDGTYTLTFTP